MSQAPDPAPGPLRMRIEQVSTPTLTRLSRLPRVLPFVVMLALIVAGLIVHGPVGFVLILLAVLVIAWVVYLAWPTRRPVEHLMSLAVLLLSLALAVLQLFPHHR